MIDEENQMGLFEAAGIDPFQELPAPLEAAPTAPQPSSVRPEAPAPKAKPRSTAKKPATPPARRPSKPLPRAAAAPQAKKISGLVPEGDVRLTANIRQDLHLKLKIASAYRRTTIGEILEELIETHL